MQSGNAVDEDWDLLVSFFPSNWRDLARRSAALKGLRQDKWEEHLLRVLLLHVGCGFSIRGTGVRAQQAKLAQHSAVALFKRLRSTRDRVEQARQASVEERGLRNRR